MTDYELRKELARELLASGIEPIDLVNEIDVDALPAVPELAADLGIAFPQGLAPLPMPIEPEPDMEDPLPRADVLVVTWTIAELNGLADVMTPGFDRRKWYRYRRRFDDHYANLIRSGAPASKSRRLGSYFQCRVGSKRVLCFKSELHLNQDGKNLNPDGSFADHNTGRATLPVKDLFQQLIDEVQPELVITTGTSGATFLDHGLGDVAVTRGASFRLSDEFAAEDFNGIDVDGAQYKSDWTVPTVHFAKATEIMSRFANRLREPEFGPPTKRYDPSGPLARPRANEPKIHMDGTGGLPEFHPILSTDFFEFGTSSNGLEEKAIALEMGDAVLGLVCSEMADPPRWLVVRNISDPQINGDLPDAPRKLNMQVHWAVWYYEVFGYWTSVNGALATWAVIAGTAS